MKGLSPSKLSIISLNNINFLILGFVFFLLSHFMSLTCFVSKPSAFP